MESYYFNPFPPKPSEMLKAACKFYLVINAAFPRRENLVGVHMSYALGILQEIANLEREINELRNQISNSSRSNDCG